MLLAALADYGARHPDVTAVQSFVSRLTGSTAGTATGTMPGTVPGPVVPNGYGLEPAASNNSEPAGSSTAQPVVEQAVAPAPVPPAPTNIVRDVGTVEMTTISKEPDASEKTESKTPDIIQYHTREVEGVAQPLPVSVPVPGEAQLSSPAIPSREQILRAWRDGRDYQHGRLERERESIRKSYGWRERGRRLDQLKRCHVEGCDSDAYGMTPTDKIVCKRHYPETPPDSWTPAAAY